MTDNLTSRLILGTAQMGMAYGIANSSAPPSEKRIQEYLEYAFETGVINIDTASSYGRAESLLGRSIGALGIANRVRLFTKLTQDELLSDDMALSSIEKSLKRLGISKLHGLFAHFSPESETKQLQIIQRLALIKKSGYASHVGFSLYDTEFAAQSYNEHEIDLFQAPVNVLDRRTINNGFMSWCRAKNKLFALRSVFLQGLLCNHYVFKDRLKVQFHAPLISWFDFCREQKVNPAAAALQIALSMGDGNPVIVGFDSLIQLKEILQVVTSFDVDKAHLLTKKTREISQQRNFDIRLIQPDRWPEIMKH